MGRTEPSELPAYLRARMTELDIGSLRGLARRVDVAPETARRLLTGTATPDETTLRKIADRLPAPLSMLRQLAGRPAGERAPFVLPPEADQLDERQRGVVLAMVHVLLDAAMHRAPGAGDGLRLVGRRRDPDGPDGAE